MKLVRVGVTLAAPWALVACLALVGWGGAASGADEKPPEVAPPDPDVSRADLAFALAEYGRKNKSPEALVTAAQILSKLQVADPVKEGEKPKESEDHLAAVNQLLDEAAALGGGDPVIKELVGRAREALKERPRGLFNFEKEINKTLKRIRVQMNAGKNVVARQQYAQGQTISVTSEDRSTQLSVVNAQTGQVLASGVGSVTTLAPATGTYVVEATPPPTAKSGTVGAFSLK